MVTNGHINFSEYNIELLISLTHKLENILNRANFSKYIAILNKIKFASISRDNEDFNKYVLDNTLFGGAGALWEIYIDNEKERIEFNETFCQYIDHLKFMGINNGRVDQVRETLPELL